MTNKKHFYENMQAMAECLAKDPETKDRYDKATHGGKEWFCFSRWIMGSMARWNDAEAVEYRDALVGRLASTDIAYVLQYETAPDVVAYLKRELIAAVGRETAPEQLAKRGDWTANARMRGRHITANPPQEAESWTGRKIQIGTCFYSKMLPIKEVLSKDSDTKQHYEFLRHGGKEWLYYSWWISEDSTRWNDPEAVEYRDSLTSWIGSIDIVYVLQFEADTETVDYLRNRLVATLERETTPGRLHLRSTILGRGLHKPWKGPEGIKTTSQVAAQYGSGCGMICRFYSAMKGYADYLRGNAPGPSFWTHPDVKLYLKWHNRYSSPTSGLCRVQ